MPALADPSIAGKVAFISLAMRMSRRELGVVQVMRVVLKKVSSSQYDAEAIVTARAAAPVPRSPRLSGLSDDVPTVACDKEREL